MKLHRMDKNYNPLQQDLGYGPDLTAINDEIKDSA